MPMFLLAFSAYIVYSFNVYHRILAEFQNAYESLLAFLFIILFTFVAENVKVHYRDTNFSVSLLSAIMITLWYGPYSAAFIISFICLFRVNNVYSVSKVSKIWKVTARFCINFLMYVVPAEIMYQPYPFSLKLMLYLAFAIIVNLLIMHFYYPLFLKKKSPGFKKSLYILTVEFIPISIIMPIVQTIHELQLKGMLEFLKLYYIFPLVLVILVVLTRILAESLKINTEREKLQHFQKALKGILSGLKLVRSTEESGVILQKTTKLLAELLGYKQALISLINKEDNSVERIGYYGIKEAEFEALRTDMFASALINRVFTAEFEFAGTYFVPAESGILYEIYPETEKHEFGKPDLWHEDDLFLVPLFNSEGLIIGYISLDFPIDGKRPNEEDAEIARIFAEQIGRMLETSVKYKEIVETTQIDRMTKLCNHTYFYERADELIKRSDFVKPLSFLILDIDDFKKFNDKYGHLTGDNVLINVARILRQNVPQNSIVARYGGEEFAVLFPDTSKIMAVAYANKLVKEVRNTKIDGLSVTISCGVSTFPEDGRFSSTLVSAADSALYISKKTGKDKVTMV